MYPRGKERFTLRLSLEPLVRLLSHLIPLPCLLSMDTGSVMVRGGSEDVIGATNGDEIGNKIGREVEPSDVMDPKKPDQTPTPPPISTSPKPTKITMPSLVDLSQIPLHSPSSQIVGTPFATNSTRFEYPFPDASPSSEPTSQQSGVAISSSAGTLSMPLSVIAVSPPLATVNSFPILSTATLHTRITSNSSSTTVSSITLPSLGLTHPPLAPSDIPSYNPAHPKLRTKNPPVPPSLVKKRTRWILGLGLGSLGRRRSSSATSGSPGSENALRFGHGEEPGRNSPLGSPQEEQNAQH